MGKAELLTIYFVKLFFQPLLNYFMNNEGIFFLMGTFFISIILITIIHEMGHALLASYFSKKDVKVFFGSYGEVENSFYFKIGRMHFYTIKNFRKWRGGLCINEGGMSFYQNALYILAGTFFPLLTGIILVVITKESSNYYFYWFPIFFLIATIISLIINLYPNKKAIKRKNGTYNPNDGYLLKQLFRYRKNYNEYITAIATYNEKKYSDVALQFKALIDLVPDDQMLIRLCLSSAAMSKNLELIKGIIDEYENSEEFDLNDWINIGYYYSNTGNNDKAMEYYKKALAVNRSWHALNNIGYSLNLKGEYSEALLYFDEALSLDSHAYTYNNRGLAKIKLGDIEEGLKNLEQGHKLDPTNSYYYKNMGIYHFDRSEYQSALEYFEKAKEIDPTTNHIEEDIEAVKIKLEIA